MFQALPESMSNPRETVHYFMDLAIIPFESQYAHRFRDLNLEWVEKYFRVEEKDREMLEHCEKNIIAPGGAIFFARYCGNIVGCFAFIPLGQKVFELGKMAVSHEFQGLRIGQELLKFAIAHGQARNWDKIVLYSNTKLDSALHIYRKFGFREVDIEKDVPYVRSNIKMELILKKNLKYTI
jgi:ribosomal protein S18 acetylase RimI-like enzyme